MHRTRPTCCQAHFYPTPGLWPLLFLWLLLPSTSWATPVNDLCANAIELTLGASVNGTTVAATSTGAPASCTGVTLSSSTGVWYRFTGTGSTTVLAILSASFDTRVAVFSGSCGALTCVAANNNNSCNDRSRITMTTAAGTTYHVYVAGIAQGTFSLVVQDSDPGTNTTMATAQWMECGEALLSNNIGVTPTPVTTTGCSAYSGTSSKPARWYRVLGDGRMKTAQVFSFGWDVVIAVQRITCSGLVCVGWSDSDNCTEQVSWTTVPGETYMVTVHPFSSATGWFELRLTCSGSTGPAPNDACTAAIPVAVDCTVHGNTGLGTPDDVPGGCGSVGAGLWYSVVGNGQPMTASLCGSQFDTQLALYTGSCGALSCVAFNDDHCGPQSELEWASVSGTTYLLYVSGAGTGNFSLSISTFEGCIAPAGTVALTEDCDAGTYTVTLTLTGMGQAASVNVVAQPSEIFPGGAAYNGPLPATFTATFPVGEARTVGFVATDVELCQTILGTFNGGGCILDCNNEPGGTAFLDNCGTCVGGSTGLTACIADCYGVFGGTASIDDCGACSGGTTGVSPNSTCVQDCAGVWNGMAFTDACGNCVGGSTGANACVADCNSVFGGTAFTDGCGTCVGGNTGLTPCAIPNTCSTAQVLAPGVPVVGNTNQPAITNEGQPTFTCGTPASTARGLWYSITGICGTAMATNCGGGTTYDSKLFVYAGTCGATTLTCVAGNDDFCGLQAQVTWTATPGVTYYILQTGFSASAGPFTLVVNATACADCAGVEGGTAFLDDCGTCVGGNTGLDACVADCNGDFGGTASVDDCGVCAGGETDVEPNSSCTQDCAGSWGGTAVLDDCGTCVGGNTGEVACVADCNGDFGGSANIDNCGNCVGGNTGQGPCIADCNGIFGGNAFRDNCNNCVGGNTGLDACVADCNGDFGGLAVLDNCGNCVGGNTGEVACVADCNGDFGGNAVLDNCGNCVGGNSGEIACVADCNGYFGGTAVLDNCGNCVGGNTGEAACVADCNGDFGGNAVLDNCGNCVGGNSGEIACVADCNGDFGGTAVLDNCGNCVSGNTGEVACVADCNGDFGGTAVLDNCGNCVSGNTGEVACVADCNGDFGGNAVLDNCGNCVGGNSGEIACVADCNGDFGGNAVLDNCGNCVSGNTGEVACVADCNGDFGGTAVLDNCGTCVGGNTGEVACAADCNGDFGGAAYLDPCGACIGGITGIGAISAEASVINADCSTNTFDVLVIIPETGGPIDGVHIDWTLNGLGQMAVSGVNFTTLSGITTGSALVVTVTNSLTGVCTVVLGPYTYNCDDPCELTLAADAGADALVFFGPYTGQACTTLNGTASGGTPFPGGEYLLQWGSGTAVYGTSLPFTVCPTVSSTYILTVTDANGCVTTDEVHVEAIDTQCGGPGSQGKVRMCINGVNVCIANQAVEAVLAGNPNANLGPCPKTMVQLGPGLTLYPNPNNGQLVTLTLNDVPDDTERIGVEIFDLTGMCLQSEQHAAQGSAFLTVMDLNGDLAPGVYLVLVNVGEHLMTQRLVIAQ